MRTHLIYALSILFIGTLSFAQADAVLYRGLSNEIHLNNFGYDSLLFELKAFENVKLSKNQSGVYVALPQSDASASLVVMDLEGSHIDTLVFQVLNRPLPLIYLCGVEQGQSIESLCGTLELRYPEGITIPANFKIVAWEISQVDLGDFGEKGEFIQQLEDSQVTLTSNTEILIFIQYMDEYNVLRIAKGVWTYTNN